ncbi:protein of unknown function [Thauera humireducens]|nr:protein of unknown function [Thauera humireducens]
MDKRSLDGCGRDGLVDSHQGVGQDRSLAGHQIEGFGAIDAQPGLREKFFDGIRHRGRLQGLFVGHSSLSSGSNLWSAHDRPMS